MIAIIITIIGCVFSNIVICQCGTCLNKQAKIIAVVAIVLGVLGIALPALMIGGACRQVAEDSCRGDGVEHMTHLCNGVALFWIYFLPFAGGGQCTRQSSDSRGSN